MKDPARRAALDVLVAVRTDDAYANLVLPHVLAKYELSGRDAGFATELASGTLRQQGTYDAILAACLDRPLARVQAKVLDVLRLGAHQILSMRVPTFAAIDATVELAKQSTNASGLVNAVLRKVAARELDEWLAVLVIDDPLDRAAMVHSHPRWVVEALRQSLQGVGASSELDALLTADNLAPQVTLVARPGRSEVDELPGERTAYSPFGVVLESGSPSAVDAVREKRAGVQDEGSQLVALALADAPLVGRDELWLDICAGPGGKAALLEALADVRGAVLVANERQLHRAGLVAAHGVRRVVAGDGASAPFAAGTFDRLLVDAPCSGLGALRRRPEARWRKKPADIAELVPLQERLLTAALRLVRPGGVVLYATCSPVADETRGVVESVLTSTAAELVPIDLGVPDSAGPIPGTVQLWPHRHGTDAMFMALLQRPLTDRPLD
ncbi:RsmB/NOP family class I SAM-dependent RNA methyltransferase [Nocardioides baekrokdamisoli]